MLFFQSCLLLGYGYSHWASRGGSRWRWAHCALLALPMIWMPFRPCSAPLGPSSSAALFFIIGQLAVTAGPALTALSATAPLLQAWISGSSPAGVKPVKSGIYSLYSVSNAGSLLALVAYPLYIEPAWSLRDQSRLWHAGYVALVAGMCAVAMSRGGESRPASAPVRTERIAMSRKVRWVVLAFLPSSAMLGLTTYLSTDVTSMPLLWVAPLFIYILSYVLAFSDRAIFAAHRWDRTVLFALIFIGMMMSMQVADIFPLSLVIVSHLAVFFILALFTHSSLADSRPEPEQLTGFYLWLAVGGALGGLFNGLAAPHIFSRAYEYPLILAAFSWLRPKRTPENSALLARALFIAVPAAVYIGMQALLSAAADTVSAGPAALPVLFFIAIFGVPPVLLFILRKRTAVFALTLAAFMLAPFTALPRGQRLETVRRSFFGVSAVRTADRGARGVYRELMHGTTLHGIQAVGGSAQKEALGYFHRTGPAGQVFEWMGGKHERLSVAVIGLGAGSMAAYARPGERWDFYEIDPVVKELASDTRFFTYLSMSAGDVHVHMGDGRLNLAGSADAAYDLIVVDAFSSDSIPVHLMTREAIEMYLTKLHRGGVLLFHVTNRYFKPELPLSAAMRSLGLKAYLRRHRPAPDPVILPSKWLLVAKEAGAAADLVKADPEWQPAEVKPAFRVWTDDYSNILSAL